MECVHTVDVSSEMSLGSTGLPEHPPKPHMTVGSWVVVVS